MTSHLKRLTAILLSDGIPGHFRCAEGVIEAARRLRAIDIVRIDVRRSCLFPAGMASWMVRQNIAPRTILRLVYGLDLSDLAKPDLIVSAGGDTLAANVVLARLTKAPNIFFGSLRRYAPDNFALALNAYPPDRAGGNQARILKPSPADPSLLPVPDLDHRRLPKVSGLLIGGVSGDARWGNIDWDRLLDFLHQTRHELGMSWIVSNSRRTPDDFSDRVRALADVDKGPIHRFIDVRSEGSGTLGDLFAACGAVAVTADSSAMLSEAIWMCRPVVALRPASMNLPEKETEYRQWLEGRNLYRADNLSDVTAERYAGGLREVIPLSENPQVELARVLAEKLPPIFGPVEGPI